MLFELFPILAVSAMAPDVIPGRSVTSLIAGSSLFAKAILTILLGFSIVSWGIILAKWRQFSREARHSKKFLRQFSRARNLREAISHCGGIAGTPYLDVLRSGARELEKISMESEANPGPAFSTSPQTGIQRIDSATEAAAAEAIMKYESQVSFLATTANTSPFLGLLGTVVGIMISFQDIGIMKSASLAVVAPGIAEALIATVAGLAAAIPAVVAYNYYTARVRNLSERLDVFRLKLLNLLAAEIPR